MSGIDWSNPKVVAVAASIGIAAIGLLLARSRSKKKPERKEGVVYLHQFGRAMHVPNASPFCLKVETFMRMYNVPYEVVQGFPVFSSKGKMPWIEYNGKNLADSTFILEFLDEERKLDVDGDLSEVEKAQALGIKIMCEEHLYWAMVYCRWIDSPLSTLLRVNRIAVPFPLNYFFFGMAKRNIKKYLHGQGMGRHTREEIYEFAFQDIRAISTLLGKKKFMMGDKMTSIDAVVFSFMAPLVFDPVGTSLGQEVNKYDNIVAYVKKFKEKFYPDWDKLCPEWDKKLA